MRQLPLLESPPRSKRADTLQAKSRVAATLDQCRYPGRALRAGHSHGTVSRASTPFDMTNGMRGSGDDRGWLGTMLRDVHFWVPIVVLLGGLLVLRWIH